MHKSLSDILVKLSLLISAPFVLLAVSPALDFYFLPVPIRPRKGRGLKKSEEKNDSADTEQQDPWQFEENQRLYWNEERRVQSHTSQVNTCTVV